MKRHPFFEHSFVIRLAGSNRIVTAIRTDGGGDSAAIVDVQADKIFVITSRIAHQIVKRLVSDPEGRERLAYGSGYRFANVLTLDQFVLIDTKNSSRVHVDPDPASRLRALGELDRYRLALQCLIHSHPGCTEHSVNPSSTDLETQQNLEAQYGSIGIICNAGGWLQFLSTSQLFQIVIVGKGVEDHGFRQANPGFRHLFRLCHLGEDSLPAAKRGWLGRIADRSARAVSVARPKKSELSLDDLIRSGRWIPRG